jgi:tRNA A-37 threonylcarbamoyl transferase component Bud32
MGSLKTPPRLGLRVPLPPAPREPGAPSEPAGLVPGDLLEGRYQIEDRLGEGGVGFVFRARQLKLHRRVAIKLLQQDTVGDEALKLRFEREALTLAALSHPNIVNLNDYGMARGQPFIVMELLEGSTLREIIDREGAIAPVRALGFVRQVLLALAYAHGLGIVHRDLKPANLLVQELPCVEHLKVLDFGLVKLIPGSYLDNGAQLSRVGFTFGTPAYMSPEHASGAEVDGRADLYALGVLLFELLTGKKPFEGELQDVLRHHFQTPVPALASFKPELAPLADLNAIVQRAMAKERVDRYADAAAMLAVVDAAIARLNAPPPAPTTLVAGARERGPTGDRVRALGAEAQRVTVDVAKRARAALREGQRLSAPHIERVGQAVRVGMREAAQRTRVVSGKAWVAARPKLRLAVATLGAFASRARARITGSAQRLIAKGQSPRLPTPADDAVREPASASVSGPAPQAPWSEGGLPEQQVRDGAVGEGAAADALADATVVDGLSVPSDHANTVAVRSSPPGAPEG